MSFYDVLLAQDLNENTGGGSTVTVDTQMSDTSTNPVQNKVIKEYVDEHCDFFQCEFTFDNHNDEWTCDKTVDQIIEAFKSGKNINCIMPEVYSNATICGFKSFEEGGTTYNSVSFLVFNLDALKSGIVSYYDDGYIVVSVSS